MAHSSADVQLAHLHSTEQVQVEEQLVETEQREDLDELGEPVSGFNSASKSPPKSAMARPANTPGVLRRVTGYLTSYMKTVSREPQDLQMVEDGSAAERNQTITESATGEGQTLPTPKSPAPRAQLRIPNSTALKSPSRAPASLADHVKRKRVDGADAYEVEVSPQGSDLQEDVANRATKRSRHIIKAKPPLTKPITSKGYTSYHIRQQKGNNIPGLGEIETTANAPASSLIGKGNIASLNSGEQANPAAKRGRGRPRKNPHQEPAHQSGPRTPKKGLASLVVSNSRTPKDVENEEENGVEKNQYVVNETEVVEAELEAPSSSSSGSQDSLIDKELLKRLWDRADHAGQKLTKKQQTWSRQQNEELWTGYGKRMDKRLKAMVVSYGKLQKLKTARDQYAFQEAHKDIEEGFELLRHEADKVLLSRFDPGSDTKMGKNTLTDLYFHTLPQTILAIRKAVEVYDDEGSIETLALQEISELVKLLYDLASFAVKQPKEIQPKPNSKNSSYQISQPTRSNLPEIRNLQERISVELRSRETAKKLAEEELLRPERERRYREKEEREEAELRRKREERHRMQGEHWWDLQNNYFPDPWNHILRINIANLESKSTSWHQEAAIRKGKGREESVELGNAGTYSAESRHHSEQNVERISMFPQNNINELSPLESLTHVDMSIFVDCMRYEEVEDRYERAAEQLGRSMDEVFALARDFQEAMDFQHEQGNYNEARDEWTYSVWVENQ